jgi:hypothetical protein
MFYLYWSKTEITNISTENAINKSLNYYLNYTVWKTMQCSEKVIWQYDNKPVSNPGVFPAGTQYTSSQNNSFKQEPDEQI